jgi:protein-disulfide isomerase
VGEKTKKKSITPQNLKNNKNKRNAMTKVKIYLFTSQTCPHCPLAKEELQQLLQQRHDIDAEFLDVHSSRGQELGREFGLKSVPTYVIQGPGHKGNMGLNGSQGLEKLNKFVDVALGKIDLKKNEKGFKGFLKKIGIEIN